MSILKKSFILAILLLLVFVSFSQVFAVSQSVSISASSNPICSFNGLGGRTALFATAVNPGSGFYYEWRVNGEKFSSQAEMNSVFEFNPNFINGNVKVQSILRSNSGISSSNIITLTPKTLSAVPSVMISTGSTHLAPGTPATFTATTSNVVGTPTYQWNVNGQNISGANNSTYTYTPLAGDAIRVIMNINSVSCSVTSSNVIYISHSCPEAPVVSYEGKTYNTTKIGEQCWLKENLNVGTKITNTQNQTNNNVVEKYCYDNSDANCDTYGGLYQWAEAVAYKNGVTNSSHWSPLPVGPVQGICPTGWHIPSWEENVAMQNNLLPIPGGKMKEPGTEHWMSPNNVAKNSSGFTSLGSGFRSSNGISFGNLKSSALYWTIKKGTLASAAKYFGTTYVFPQTLAGEQFKTTGISIRCLKDETSNMTASVSITQFPIGGMVNFVATPVNGGTNPTYQWKKNGQNVTTAQPLNPPHVFVLANPTPGDVITVEMTSSLAGVTASPATSNAITVTGAPATAPDAPTNIIVVFDTIYGSNSSATTAELSWTPPMNNGGAPIYGYKVEYRQTYPTLAAWSSVITQGTSTTITGLVAGARYDYKISSISSITSVGQGPSSSIITAPSKITGLVVTPEGPGKVLLSWTTPNNGGSPLTHFRIRYKATDVTPIPNNWGTYLRLNEPNATSTYITGLTPGKTYEFKIRPVGSSFGEWSDLASATVASISSSSLIAGVGNADFSLSGIQTATEIASDETSNTFSTSLSYGKKHNDVKTLQSFLNSKGYNVTKPGKETSYFGKATKAALIKFQEDNNIIPASGNLGIKTRTLINQMVGE